MAQHRLDPLREKVKRARTHLAAIDAEFQTFLDTEPHSFIVEKHGQTPWYTSYLGACQDPPLHLSVLAGETVYQLRSVLEHLIWMLVEANGQTPGEHNSFPVRLKPFANQTFEVVTRGSQLRGVPRAAIALIEQAQPYHAPQGAQHHWLAILEWLAKVDRHRTLHRAWSAMDPAEGVRDLFHPDPGYTIHEFEPLFERGLLLEPGTKVARFRVEPTSGLESKVDMHGKFPALVAFGDQSRAVPSITLVDLNNRVAVLVEQLANVTAP